MLPAFIRARADFDRIVKLLVTPESDVLEFKETLDGFAIPRGAPNYEKDRRKGQKELCRDIAQFANTWGGVKVVGVGEDEKTAPGIARHIVSIADLDGMREWIAQAVLNYLVPSTLTYDLVPIETDAGIVLAVNVPAHADTVALWDRADNTMQYVRRQGSRKVYMNPIEAEQHRMSNNARAMRLKLESMYGGGQRKNATLIDGLWISAQGQRSQRAAYKAAQVQIASLGDDTFNLNVPVDNASKVVPIPYDAIEMAWIDGWDRISLLLRVRLVTEGSGLYVESR